MMTWKVLPLVALAGALWLQSAPVAAQGGGPGKGACRDDVKRLCGDQQYKQGGIAACLEQHSSELSPACAQRFTMMKARMDEFQKACGADAKKLCPTADRGPKTMRCLHDHEADLSQPCKDQMAAVKERFQQRHKGGDAAGEPPSGT